MNDFNFDFGIRSQKDENGDSYWAYSTDGCHVYTAQVEEHMCRQMTLQEIYNLLHREDASCVQWDCVNEFRTHAEVMTVRLCTVRGDVRVTLIECLTMNVIPELKRADALLVILRSQKGVIRDHLKTLQKKDGQIKELSSTHDERTLHFRAALKDREALKKDLIQSTTRCINAKKRQLQELAEKVPTSVTFD